MKSFRPFLLAFAAFACLAVCAAAQDAKPVKTAPRLTTAISGKALFGQYCAVCHGVDGRGAGPAATALKQSPTDLTRLSRENKGEFPEANFMKMMNGELEVAAHCSSSMRIWGDEFRHTTSSPNVVQDRLHSLLSYVESLQVK